MKTKTTAAQRRAQDERVIRIAAEATGAFETDSKMIARAAEVAFDAWVREAGFRNDARVPEYRKLSAIHHKRWEAIARDVIAASRSEGGFGSEGRVQRDDARPDRLRSGDRKAQAQVPRDRNRGTRRSRKV